MVACLAKLIDYIFSFSVFSRHLFTLAVLGPVVQN